MNFGINFHGKHAVIKLNCKLDKDNYEFMYSCYSDVLDIFTTEDKKGNIRTRFEGCILASEYAEFKLEFDKSIKRTKINKLHKELLDMEASVVEEARLLYDDRLSDPLDDLHF